MKIFTSLLFSILLSVGMMAQSQISSVAVQHIADTYEQQGLKASDIENVIVDHAYTDKNGISFIYLVQTYEGVPVYNAIMTVAISKKGEIFTTANRFVSDLHSKVASTETVISAEEAIQTVAKHFKTETSISALRTDRATGVSYFSANELANSEIPVSFKYEADAEGKLHKSYDLSVDMKANSDYWSVRVDAATGKILSKNNFTVYCNFNHNNETSSNHNCTANFLKNSSFAVGDGASYRVYPFPAESPLETDHVLVLDPSDANASPLGWHDTDGMDGAEFTITRGNNVHAYIDSLSNNNSVGGEPDGGEDLVFDFEHDQSMEPNKSTQAAQVNLFYANNYLHDFTYNLGFDEAAGNFQQTNYSNEGDDNDYVRAEAIDGDGTNNARFSTLPDGTRGRMEMFLWDNPGGTTFATVNSPEELAGTYPTGNPDWGFPISEGNDAVTGKAVLFNDGTQFASQGCNPAINVSSMTGNIALIDRGSCEFGAKALNAQEAGAVGVIICNVAGVNGGTGEELLNMGAGVVGGQVTIPVRAFRLSDCNRIKASMDANIDVNISLVYTGFDEPAQLDASYDNGVIAHEFAHGISNRLTGGPNAAGCLTTQDTDGDGMADTGEQAGEGWSDYVALISTLKAGDSGADEKPIGSYVDGSTRGIRRFPYSTDMSICPLTYNDIRVGGPVVDADDNFAPHPVGELMAALGWDLTWAMIDKYGLDPTWQDQTSGNYIGAKLVFDGMKLQPCNPGYTDIRDAILFADQLNNEGANICEIWDVFARRGLGMEADQGSPIDHLDGTEDFTAMATCIEKLKVTREISELVQPGATLDVNVTATNHTKPEGPVASIVTEKLQEGLLYKEGSAPFPATVNGNIITFDIGELDYDTPLEFSYEVESSTSIRSISLNLETLEDGGSNFEFFDLNDQFNFFFDTEGRNGTRALGGAAPDTEVDFGIITPVYDVPADVEVPALRFWHKYDLEQSADAVFLSISTDGGTNWNYVTEFLKNGYDDDIQYGTFAIPSLRAFTGSTNGEFIDSYVDLSAYKGESIQIRFRLGTDDNTTVDADFPGWIVDDIELMDLTLYEVETCIGTTAEPEVECNGTTTIIVDSNLDTNTEDTNGDIYEMSVYPNPAKTKIYLDVAAPLTQAVQIKLTSLDGRLIRNTTAQVTNSTKTIGFDIVDLDSGMYLIQVQSEQRLSTRKFVKN